MKGCIGGLTRAGVEWVMSDPKVRRAFTGDHEPDAEKEPMAAFDEEMLEAEDEGGDMPPSKDWNNFQIKDAPDHEHGDKPEA